MYGDQQRKRIIIMKQKLHQTPHKIAHRSEWTECVYVWVSEWVSLIVSKMK